MFDHQYKELRDTLQGLKRYFIYAGAFSAGVNLLMLVPIIYMLQIYDRVITSGSLSTLTMLTLLLVLLLCAMGALEWVRSMIMVAASNRIEKNLRERVFDASFMQAVSTGGARSSSQYYHDLSNLRQFLTSNGFYAFFDAPWFPIYVVILFLFHPWFGIAAIFAGVIMFVLALANEQSTSLLMKEANDKAIDGISRINDNLRNAEVIAAMGMANNVRKRQDIVLDEALIKQTDASQKAGLWTSSSRSARVMMQSLLLGLGAYLALNQQITAGMMIAGSLLLGRALAPIDLFVGAWRGFSLARAQYGRLGELLESVPVQSEKMQLPTPSGELSLESVFVVAPGQREPLLSAINLEVNAGEAVGIVGPSASGKSSLVRTILGIWPAARGTVRLDGADITGWDREALGIHVGYLPQDIELFNGTVSENICRFGEADAEKIVSAAKLSGVHRLILKLPRGYDTVIGTGGATLSGGQRQSIALARAVYDAPRLLVLDEPNSNLDEQGERELIRAIHRIKETGATVIIVTHRTAVLSGVDKIVVLNEGKIVGVGPREKMLGQLLPMRTDTAQGIPS